MGRNGFGALLVGGVLAMTPAARAADAPAPSAANPAGVRIGAAYVAKQFCSCLFLSGRSQTSCRAEFRPQIDQAEVAIDWSGLPDRAKVAVTFGPILAEAAYSRRYGCVLVK